MYYTPFGRFANCRIPDSYLNLEHLLEGMLDEEDSPQIAHFLKAVDVHIDGFRVERDSDGRRQRVYVKHNVGGSEHELRLSEGSAGTQKLMGRARIVMIALEEGGTVLVDELDAEAAFQIAAVRDPAVQGSQGQQRWCSAHIYELGRLYHAQRRLPP